MSWVILEGLDRTGKSSVANMYKARGYQVVHMSAPDKKYTKPGYTGPSYMDEILDIYMRYNQQDVVFDRSPYGEQVWPLVYGRKAQLDEEEMEVLQEIENQNEVERLMFHDENVEAHWKRCVDNREPLTRAQFNQANILFERVASKHGFRKVQLKDFSAITGTETVNAASKTPASEADFETVTVTSKADNNTTVVQVTNNLPKKPTKSAQQIKLEKANAINELLEKRIIKQKGELFDDLEKDIRSFLESKLADIFGSGQQSAQFSRDEVEMLKIYCAQLKKKLGAK
jgi:hypothetical protein